MAKINARGARQIGPTLYTERVRPGDAHDVDRVYVEAFRLRSDGAVLTRIMRTRPVAEDGIAHSTEHSSGFRILGVLSKDAVDQGTGHDDLRAWLIRKGYTITKETWR